MTVFMTKPFARFARKAGLGNPGLRKAAEEVAAGAYDADLGGDLFKQRVTAFLFMVSPRARKRM